VSLKCLLKIPVSLFSGYGNDGVGLVAAMERAGIDVRLQPTHVDPPLPDPILRALQKPLEAPFDLIINHVDPTQLQSVVRKESKTDEIEVAWTMWEFLKLVPEYEPQTNPDWKPLRKRLENFDILFTYDEVSYQALDPHVPEGVVHSQLQGGYDPTFWERYERDWFSERFMFCMVGALNARKAPFDVIEAFRTLKMDYPDDVTGMRLGIKTNVPSLHPAMADWCPDLRIYCDTWPRETLRDFYHASHVLLAPSWGEGKNVPAMEMMTTGGAVAMSDFGGHRVWGSSEYSYPLGYTLATHTPEYPANLSARVSKETLMETMLHMYRNRDEVKRKADLASRIIPQMCSWDAVVDNLFRKIADVLPGRGDALFARYTMAKSEAAREVPR